MNRLDIMRPLPSCITVTAVGEIAIGAVMMIGEESGIMAVMRAIVATEPPWRRVLLHGRTS
jgi:hypothetical protein